MRFQTERTCRGNKEATFKDTKMQSTTTKTDQNWVLITWHYKMEIYARSQIMNTATILQSSEGRQGRGW